MNMISHALPFAVFAAIGLAAPLLAQNTPENIDAVTFDAGRWYAANDVPTYKVEEDGTIDWASYSGFRRYHSECHVCHGPEGEGSSWKWTITTSSMS